MGWYGVDLDGTLAVYNKWEGPLVIGAPVPKMVERVKYWLMLKCDVRIFTARVSPISLSANKVTREAVVSAIMDWCFEHVGARLPVTCEKDLGMIGLWDDRCVQIVPNTGVTALDAFVQNLKASQLPPGRDLTIIVKVIGYAQEHGDDIFNMSDRDWLKYRQIGKQRLKWLRTLLSLRPITEAVVPNGTVTGN